MSYDDWKCAPPEGDQDAYLDALLGDELHEECEPEPEFTCDCGNPIDPTLGGVSLCRECYEDVVEQPTEPPPPRNS